MTEALRCAGVNSTTPAHFPARPAKCHHGCGPGTPSGRLEMTKEPFP
ncbi:hypothetical protein BN2537_12531 [Streptomyces venezuelae]|nr:hypothetical protein BN2537_12531 [Streptomyces venezuelae]